MSTSLAASRLTPSVHRGFIRLTIDDNQAILLRMSSIDCLHCVMDEKDRSKVSLWVYSGGNRFIVREEPQDVIAILWEGERHA